MFESRSSRPTESFYNTGENTGESTASSTCVQHGLQSTLNHITSNFSGASFDFRSYTDPSNSSNNIIMVYQKPIRSGEHTHVLAVNDSGNLVTQPEDENNPQQRWVLRPVSGSSGVFEVVSSSWSFQILNHDGTS